MPFTKLSKDDAEAPFKPIPPRLGGPLWELYRDGLTQGSIGLFLSCREQFRLGMVEGWSAKKNSSALEFGSCFHYCVSQLQGSGATPEKLKACKTPAGAIKRYLRVHKSHVKLSTADTEELHLLLAQVRLVLEHYLDYWKKDDDAKDWVAREKTFLHNYPMLNDRMEFVDIPLRGRWDGLYRKPKTGALWLHETKTKGQIDTDGLTASLPVDFQTMLYCYTAEKYFNEPVAGTLYDVIRRPQLKLGKNESHKEFINRIDADITDRPKHYFHRWEVRLGKKDIANWASQQLAPVLRQVQLWNEKQDKGDSHFMTPKALFTAFGKCDLFQLMMNKNAYNLYRRRHVYPELID